MRCLIGVGRGTALLHKRPQCYVVRPDGLRICNGNTFVGKRARVGLK